MFKKTNLKRMIAMAMAMLLMMTMFAGCKTADDTNTPEEQEKKTPVESVADTISGIYGTLLADPTQTSTGMQVDMTVHIGDYVIDMLEQMLAQQGGSGYDLDWLKEIGMGIDADVVGSLVQMDIALKLASHQLISVNSVVDYDGGAVYLAFPELSSKYVEMDFSSLGLDMISFTETQQMMNELRPYLPSEETVNKLLTKYINLAIEKLGEAEESSHTLKLDGLSQDCTEKKLTINARTAYNLVVGVLTEVKSDKDIKTIVEGFDTYYEKQSGYSVDMYESFVSSVDAILKSMENSEDTVDEAPGEILLYTYYDSSNNLIGMKLVMDEYTGNMELYYYTVTEGNTFNFEASLMDLVITGSGTKKNGTVDAEYTVNYGGTDFVILGVEDYDTASAEKGYINGTFRLEPTSSLMNMIFGGPSVAGLTDIALEMKVESSANSTNTRVDLLANDTLIVGVSMNTTTGKADNIKIPTNTVSLEDDRAMSNWVQSLDFDKVVDNIKAAGVPNEWVEMISRVIGGGSAVAEKEVSVGVAHADEAA